jgi:hypothetical protein
VSRFSPIISNGNQLVNSLSTPVSASNYSLANQWPSSLYGNIGHASGQSIRGLHQGLESMKPQVTLDGGHISIPSLINGAHSSESLLNHSRGSAAGNTSKNLPAEHATHPSSSYNVGVNEWWNRKKKTGASNNSKQDYLPTGASKSSNQTASETIPSESEPGKTQGYATLPRSSKRKQIELVDDNRSFSSPRTPPSKRVNGVAIERPAESLTNGANGTMPSSSFNYTAPSRIRSKRAAKNNHEQLRLVLVENFDAQNFDMLIYGQDGASQPPAGVSLPETAMPSPVASSESHRLYLAIDPRIHWAHNKTEAWYNRKIEEIKARGGRKRWFGKTTERIRYMNRKEQENHLAYSQALSAGNPAYKEPKPWTFNRPIDFGDVPEIKLPSYVKDNPSWVRACAWMRQCREMSTIRHRQIERLRAAGLPWDNLG